MDAPPAPNAGRPASDCPTGSFPPADSAATPAQLKPSQAQSSHRTATRGSLPPDRDLPWPARKSAPQEFPGQSTALPVSPPSKPCKRYTRGRRTILLVAQSPPPRSRAAPAPRVPHYPRSIPAMPRPISPAAHQETEPAPLLPPTLVTRHNTPSRDPDDKLDPQKAGWCPEVQ